MLKSFESLICVLIHSVWLDMQPDRAAVGFRQQSGYANNHCYFGMCYNMHVYPWFFTLSQTTTDYYGMSWNSGNMGCLVYNSRRFTQQSTEWNGMKYWQWLDISGMHCSRTTTNSKWWNAQACLNNTWNQMVKYHILRHSWLFGFESHYLITVCADKIF